MGRNEGKASWEERRGPQNRPLLVALPESLPLANGCTSIKLYKLPLDEELELP